MELPLDFRLFLAEQAAASREREVKAAKADPIKHKLTLVWAENDLRWRYFNGGVDRRGISRKFGWTTTRNAAGYFLSFVEVYDTKRGRGERKQFRASKTRNLMKERARRMYRAYANRKRK